LGLGKSREEKRREEKRKNEKRRENTRERMKREENEKRQEEKRNDGVSIQNDVLCGMVPRLVTWRGRSAGARP